MRVTSGQGCKTGRQGEVAVAEGAADGAGSGAGHARNDTAKSVTVGWVA